MNVAVDDELMDKAKAYTGLTDGSLVLDRALRALVERESARRLIEAGGSEPSITDLARRRPNE